MTDTDANSTQTLDQILSYSGQNTSCDTTQNNSNNSSGARFRRKRFSGIKYTKRHDSGIEESHTNNWKETKKKKDEEEEEEEPNFFAQVWNAIVTFIAGPPVLPNLAFLLLLVAVIFLLAKTLVNNEELRVLRASSRRNVDPFSRASESLKDARDLVVGDRIPQFGSGRLRLGGPSEYKWPIPVQDIIAVTQDPLLRKRVDPRDPTDSLCDHCQDQGVFGNNEAAQRLCIWANCLGEDGGYCRAFDISSPQYKACRVCAMSPTKNLWIYGHRSNPQQSGGGTLNSKRGENLPTCVIQTVSVMPS